MIGENEIVLSPEALQDMIQRAVSVDFAEPHKVTQVKIEANDYDRQQVGRLRVTLQREEKA